MRPAASAGRLWCAVLIPVGCLALLLVKTLGWPMISDAVLMRYVVLLMHQGMRPYSQIIDVNMPGSYLADLAVTHLFGSGPLAWRLYDYALMASAGAAILSILRRRALFAGTLCATLFALNHLADGVAQAGQRDYLVAILLLAGFAALLHTLRTGASWSILVFALSCGAATTIKPPALVFAGLALPVILARRRSPATTLPSPSLRLGLAATVGLLLPLLAASGWLAHLHSLGAFFSAARGLVAYHASMARHSPGFLLVHALPSQLLPLAMLSLVLLLLTKGWRRSEQLLTLLAVAGGLVFYCVQGKAYPYHRYPLLAFVWLLLAMQLADAFPAHASAPPGRRSQTLAWLMLGYMVLWLAPNSAVRALRYNWRYQPTLDQLEADLARLAATRPRGTLSGQVQCMDTMAGCITVLDRMQLVQSTGFLYDCYFFAPGVSPVQSALRQRFLAAITSQPPGVFVVTDQWCLNLPSGYARLERWPAFAAFLADHYTLAQQRSSPAGWSPRYTATWPFGYRLYIRK